MKRLLAAVGIMLLLGAGPASANIVYAFSGVTFDDGNTLTGTFTTNDAITSLLDFHILTTGTSGAGGGFGITYTPLTVGSSSTSLPFILVLSNVDYLLQVTFDGGLTALGAPIAIGTFASFEQKTVGLLRREITAGEVILFSHVPEPTTLALLGIGLARLGFSRRRTQ